MLVVYIYSVNVALSDQVVSSPTVFKKKTFNSGSSTGPVLAPRFSTCLQKIFLQLLICIFHNRQGRVCRFHRSVAAAKSEWVIQLGVLKASC